MLGGAVSTDSQLPMLHGLTKFLLREIHDHDRKSRNLVVTKKKKRRTLNEEL